MRRLILAAALCGAGATAALAQPAPPAPAPDKTDAQALVASGIKLFNAKDYLGALAVFRDAYTRFPSTKILLNIATTLARLDRDAEAANIYQRYLDAPDTDPAKRAGVDKALADLDQKLAVVAITVTPPDAQVQVGAGEWLAAAALAHYRLAPGDVTITARRDGFAPASKTIHADAGGELAVSLVLVAKVAASVVAGPTPPTPAPPAPAVDPRPRSRLGVIALAHVAVEHPGAAGLVGLTVDAAPWLGVQVAALIGKTSGGFAAIDVSPLHGRYRPYAQLGAPVFVASGARVSLRGALGGELVLSRRISLFVEAGVERALNAQVDVEKTVFVPAIGITGRL